MSVPADEARRIIELLGLEPLPVEGGLYRQTWRVEAVEPIAAGRMLGTAIYFALTDDPDSFSAMHRLRETEVWHFYTGDPVELLLLHPTGEAERRVLGPDVLAGQRPQVVVPPGTWMGAALVPGGGFALLGTTMVPGFDPSSFESGDRDALIAAWPDHAAAIERLTRPGAPERLPDQV